MLNDNNDLVTSLPLPELVSDRSGSRGVIQLNLIAEALSDFNSQED